MLNMLNVLKSQQKKAAFEPTKLFKVFELASLMDRVYNKLKNFKLKTVDPLESDRAKQLNGKSSKRSLPKKLLMVRVISTSRY